MQIECCYNHQGRSHNFAHKLRLLRCALQAPHAHQPYVSKSNVKSVKAGRSQSATGMPNCDEHLAKKHKPIASFRCCAVTCRHPIQPSPAQQDPASDQQKPFHYSHCRPAPVVMSTLHGQGQHWDYQPWQKAIDQFDGSEEEGPFVPPWLTNVLFTGRLPPCKDSKASFFLMPAQVAFANSRMPDNPSTSPPRK